MTKDQIKAAEKTLPRILDIPYKDWTEDQKRLDKELSCIKMINSCLIYDDDFWKAKSYCPGKNLICDEYVEELGKERVEELYKEQVEYFKHVIINRNVHTDSEGVTYNSVTEPDGLDLPTIVNY